MQKPRIQFKHLISGIFAASLSSLAMASPAAMMSAQKQEVLRTLQAMELNLAVAHSLEENPSAFAGDGDPVSAKYSQLLAGFKNSSCQGNSSQLTDPDSGVALAKNFRVAGAPCVMSYFLQQKQNPSGQVSSISEEYRGLDSTYASLTDVKFFELKRSSTLSVSPHHGMKAVIKGGGVIRSQGLGDISVDISGSRDINVDYEFSSVDFVFQFPGYTADFRETLLYTEHTPHFGYFLNGEALTEAEVKNNLEFSFVGHWKSVLSLR